MSLGHQGYRRAFNAALNLLEIDEEDAFTLPMLSRNTHAAHTCHLTTSPPYLLNPPQPSQAPLVQYIVLRRDLWSSLDWPLGSVVAQVRHSIIQSDLILGFFIFPNL